MGVGGGRGNGIREVRICEASPCRAGRVRIRRGGLVGRMGISVVLGCGMSCSRRGRGGHGGRGNSGRHTNSAGRGRDEKGLVPRPTMAGGKIHKRRLANPGRLRVQATRQGGKVVRVRVRSNQMDLRRDQRGYRDCSIEEKGFPLGRRRG